jgi:predicted component of type VI protein secretion system
MPEQVPRTVTHQSLLLRVIEELAEIKAEIKADRAWRLRMETLLDDHEDRVRSLEKRAWSTAWLTAAASAGLTAMVVALVNSQLGS